MSSSTIRLPLNKKITAAIQGELGAYSQQAVYSFFERKNVREVVTLPTLQRVFSVLTQNAKSPDFAVVPIENSLAGSIGETIDLVISKNVRIVGETSIPIRHCLIIHKNTTLDKIKKVLSHPQALAQCREYLDRNGKNWEQVSVYDTAGSVKMIKEQNLKDTAGIASELASEIYGMKLVKKGIEDDPTNTTRFVILQNADKKSIDSEPSGDDKTSAIFATKHEPGCLVKALSALSSNGINLNRIESRPFRGKPWEYYFYVDFSGHMKEEKIRMAVEELRGEVEELKILGSYKRQV
ncbi:MAG: prephenate dehydratase [Nitrososphaerales archaeon]